MSSQNTHRWVDQLEYLTQSYNSSYHSSIKQTPRSVTDADEYKIWKLLYEKENISNPPNPFKFELNDTVRISVMKGSFQRAFDDSWSREYFIIADRSIKDVSSLYVLKDIQNEIISGKFYENELQKVDVSDPDHSYIIEKILKKKGGKMLVKWLGWDHKFASWIRNSEMKSFQ